MAAIDILKSRESGFLVGVVHTNTVNRRDSLKNAPIGRGTSIINLVNRARRRVLNSDYVNLRASRGESSLINRNSDVVFIQIIY